MYVGSYMKALLMELAMAMRLFDGLRTSTKYRLYPEHRQKSTVASPRDRHDPVASENPADTIEDYMPSTEIPGTLKVAMTLQNIEAQEDRSVTSFLFAYNGFVFFLAVLFVFVCVPT